jgi:hypothetical protein
MYSTRSAAAVLPPRPRSATPKAAAEKLFHPTSEPAAPKPKVTAQSPQQREAADKVCLPQCCDFIR